MQDYEIQNVKLNSIALLKILKHAQETPFQLTNGQLLGLYNQETKQAEITYSFPEPTEVDDNYDKSMINKLEEFQFDNFLIGWYIVSYKNDYLYSDILATQFDYQKHVPFAIFLVYDILEQEKGGSNIFRVMRIKNTIFELMKETEGASTPLQLAKTLNLKYDKIFEELPVEIESSPMTDAFLFEFRKNIEKNYQNTQSKYDFKSYLDRNFVQMNELLEDIGNSEMKLQEELFSKKQAYEQPVSTKFYDSDEYWTQIIQLSRLDNYKDKIQFQSKVQSDALKLAQIMNQ